MNRQEIAAVKLAPDGYMQMTSDFTGMDIAYSGPELTLNMYLLDEADMQIVRLLTQGEIDISGALAYYLKNSMRLLVNYTAEPAELNDVVSTTLQMQKQMEPYLKKIKQDVCVNRDYAALKIGGSRHVITRRGEEHFTTYCMYSLIGFAMSGQWDVKIEFVDEFFFQVDGPKSLQILEKAFDTDFHDLKFGRNKGITFNGCELMVHRLGMSGALAYEMHGSPEYADMIYETLLKAGEEFDIRRLGTRQYCVYNHTPGGYPNFIDKEFAVDGKELEIVWGKPGGKQMKIRATVAQFPYYNKDRNETFDVEQIPRLAE